ncbi:hypothetical protein CR513_14034, partial [Mucuna pruriens]
MRKNGQGAKNNRQDVEKDKRDIEDMNKISTLATMSAAHDGLEPPCLASTQVVPTISSDWKEVSRASSSTFTYLAGARVLANKRFIPLSRIIPNDHGPSKTVSAQEHNLHTSHTIFSLTSSSSRWYTICHWCPSRSRRCRSRTDRPNVIRGDCLACHRTLVDLILNVLANRGAPLPFDHGDRHGRRTHQIHTLLPPLRGIEHHIDLTPIVTLLNRVTYKMSPEEAKEFHSQVTFLSFVVGSHRVKVKAIQDWPTPKIVGK